MSETTEATSLLRIFGTEAPKYWASGLSVIPLYTKTKKPALKNWAEIYCNRLADADEQARWVEQFRDSNIGLACGPASGVVIVDIDTDDKKLSELILAELPHSPWVRIGQKGMALAYRWTEGANWSLNLADLPGDQSRILDLLSAGRQMVLPPSIHPDTGEPYVSNVNLFEVTDELMVLPVDLKERLVTRLKLNGYKLSDSLAKKAKFTGKAAKGERDNRMIQIAGKSARAILLGEISVRRAIDDMYGWYEQEVEKDTGDQLDIEKGISSMLSFLVHDVQNRNMVIPFGWDERLTDDEKIAFGLNFDAQHEEWEPARLLSHIQTSLASDLGIVNKNTVMNFVLTKIAKSKSYSVIDIDQILQYLKDATKDKTSVGIMKKRIAELQEGPIIGANHAEIANDLVKRYKERNGDLKYWAEKFWRWNGAFWIPVVDHDLLAFISAEYGHLPTAKKAPDHGGVKKVAASICYVDSLSATRAQGINFSNGFLTEDFKLLPHDPDYGATYVLSYPYKEGRAYECVQWLSFLRDCWGDHPDFEDKVKGLQEALGVTLFGQATKYQMAFLLQGQGKTGKSQMLKVIEELMPLEARAYISPYMWADKFAPAQLAGKLVNICSELDKDKFLDARVFKDIVSADVKISGQHKNQQIFNFDAKTAHWFASNFFPKAKDTSDGFTRRWLVFTFDKVVAEDAVVVGLGEKLVLVEQDAIAAWAVEGYKRLLKQGRYTVSASHLESVQGMREANDSFKAFIFSGGRIVFEGKIKEDSLWEMYHSWTLIHYAHNKVSKQEFGRHAFSVLSGKSVKVSVEDGVKWYHGISLKK